MPEAGSETFNSLATRVLSHAVVAQPLATEVAPDSITTLSLCAELIASKASLSVPQQHNLLSLARKTCVARTVYAAYTADWRRWPGARHLEPVEWLVVAATCFLCAEPLVTSDRGLALHLINAGFRSIERADPSAEAVLHRDIESAGEAALVSARRR